MDQDLHRLLYRNAELETELRLIKEQLAQAHQANSYLLGRMSTARVPYQVSRTFPTSRFIYDAVSTSPHRELTDLLSFDEAHDSGYYDSPALTPSVVTNANGSPVTPPNESRGRGAAKEVIEKSRVPAVAQNLIDHGDSYTSPPETSHPQPEFKFLRNRPVKHSVSLGILNAHKLGGRRSTTLDEGGIRTKVEEQEGFSITQMDGTKLWVPTGGGPLAQTTPKVNDDEHIPTQEQEKLQAETPQSPPSAPTGPSNNAYPPHRTPYPRQPHPNNLLVSRWSPYNDPNNYRRPDPYNKHQRPGLNSTTELFSLPSNADERDLYRTVLITNIPTSIEIAEILAPVQGNLTTVNIVRTAGMNTVPPMQTNAVMLTFEDCVAAARFIGKCNEERPFEFKAEFHLARTGVSGGSGKQKWEGFADRRAPPPTPLWLQIDAEGGFEGRGRERVMRGEFERCRDMVEAERE